MSSFWMNQCEVLTVILTGCEGTWQMGLCTCPWKTALAVVTDPAVALLPGWDPALFKWRKRTEQQHVSVDLYFLIGDVM